MPQSRLVFLTAWLAALAVTALPSVAAPPGLPAAAPTVTPLTPSTVAEVGHTRVIHFAVDAAVAGDVELIGEVSDPDVLEIARPPAVLDGETLGTIRIRGLRAGTATLTIANAAIAVEVLEPRWAAGEEDFAPRIVGPVTGTALWGEVSIGVEVRLRPRGSIRTIIIYAGGQLALMPREDSDGDLQPYRQLRFTLDTRAAAHRSAGAAADRHRRARQRTGRPDRARAHRAPVARRDHAGRGRVALRGAATQPLRARQPPRSLGDETASGRRYVTCMAQFPIVAFPVVAVQPGWYQMMVVGRGTRAQGALPLVRGRLQCNRAAHERSAS